MKAYVTKYALTDGILTKEADICGALTNMIRIRETPIEFYHKPHWHTTPEAAVAQAEKMRLAKIKSLEKSLAKMHALVF